MQKQYVLRDRDKIPFARANTSLLEIESELLENSAWLKFDRQDIENMKKQLKE